MENNYTYLALTLLLIFLIGSAGCIKVAQNALGGGEGSRSAGSSVIPANTPPGSVAVAGQSTSSYLSGNIPTPQVTDSVTAFSPQQTPDPYPIQHGARFNQTSLNYVSFLDRKPLYSNTYTMSGYPVGLLVNVTQGPLWVVFTVDPANDCLKNPGACRGSTTVPVDRTYMTITVLDNQTDQVVAQDGYGGVYSSDTGTYGSSCNSQASTITNSFSSNPYADTCQQPGPRYITLYRQGEFRIVMNGMYCSVTVSVITGSSPVIATASPTPAGNSNAFPEGWE